MNNTSADSAPIAGTAAPVSTAHTPGPLAFREQGDANQYCLLTTDGRWVLGLLHNGEQRVEEQRANLERICRTWNAHDELVAELERARSLLAVCEGQFKGEFQSRVRACITNSRVAIAKATEAA